ncbi:MAG: choice-of-anchor K domain-containing protein, partial [Verrucomicrobiales bacterium]
EIRQRAIWMPSLSKFVLGESRTGVRKFVMNEELAKVDYGSVARNTPLIYNDADGWVWETHDVSFVASTGPSSVETTNAPSLDAGGSTGSANGSNLNPPIISPDSGSLPLASFPLQVTISRNPADPIQSSIYYSTSPGTWALYSGPISVEPGTQIQAYTSHEDPQFGGESDRAGAYYLNDIEELSLAITIPKNPITYAEAGGALEDGAYTPLPVLTPIGIAIGSGDRFPQRYQNSDNLQIYWTYDGSDPLSSGDRHNAGAFSGGYSGSIDYTLPKWDRASLLPIRIVAQSNNASIATNSAIAEANIEIDRTTLQAPIAEFDSEDTERGDMVELAKYVDAGDMPVGARIYYTIDGADPGHDGNGNPLKGTLYTGPFDPLNDAGEWETGAVIKSRVYPPEEYAGWFEVSPVASTDYILPGWEISGEATGWFSNVEGGDGLVTNINGDQTNDYFQWGDPRDWGTGANWLYFDGSSFENVGADERFEIGDLSYYNGTIAMSSAATAVDFTVQLEFGGEAIQFDYGFDLLTTPNNGTEWENADYVWFNDPNIDRLSLGTQSEQIVSLYGSDYTLNLEFGETSSDGFASIDQFHVKEARAASAKLYATLVSVGSWW